MSSARPTTACTAVDPDEIPTVAEIALIAAEMPAEYRLNVWLMSGAGLRPSEAFGASEDCQRDDLYRVYRQATDKGDGKGNRKALVPLKHRAEGDYRENAARRLAGGCDHRAQGEARHAHRCRGLRAAVRHHHGHTLHP